jgi:hypothetical protein
MAGQMDTDVPHPAGKRTDRGSKDFRRLRTHHSVVGPLDGNQHEIDPRPETTGWAGTT